MRINNNFVRINNNYSIRPTNPNNILQDPYPIQQPVFKGSLIKKLYLSGKLKLNKGIYGGDLSPSLVSDEHVLPRSKGGKNDLGNIALSNKHINNKRGNQPLSTVFNKEAFEKYCKTIEEQHLPELKGYIKKLRQTIDRVLKQGL